MAKLSAIIRDELINLPAAEPLFELKGFLDGLPRSQDGKTIKLLCPRLILGRRLLKLWKGLNERDFNAKISEEDGSLELDRKHGKAFFKLSRSVYEQLTAARYLRGGERWAWLRGLWAACGAFYLPQSGYYLSLRVNTGPVAKKAEGVLRSAGVFPKSRESRGKIEYMLRDQEQIVTCLSKMGFVRSSLVLEETAIVRSIKNRVNKLINCDTANISKSVDAAASQLELLKRIDESGLWDRMTPIQTELAAARRANPSASLGELGQMLSRPVSKSTVEYRWRKLESLIDDE